MTNGAGVFPSAALDAARPIPDAWGMGGGNEDELVARILATIDDHRETARLVAELDAARRTRLHRRRRRPLLRRLALGALVLAGGIVLGVVVARQIGL